MSGRITEVVFKRKTNLFCMTAGAGGYFFNRLFLKSRLSGIFGFLSRNYLNDFLCPLVFLGFSGILFIGIGKELRSYGAFLLLTLAAGFFWEFITPLMRPSSVTDPLDLVSYVLGMNLYYLILRWEIEVTPEEKRGRKGGRCA